MIRYICISNKKQVIFSCESEIEISIDTCQYCIKTRVLTHKKRSIVVYLKNKLKEIINIQPLDYCTVGSLLFL